MKKIVLILITIFLSTTIMFAQSNCVSLYPTNEGAKLVNKCYNAQNKLLSTTTYQVVKADENAIGSSSEIRFTTVDNEDNIVNQGVLKTACNDDIYQIKLMSDSNTANLMEMLTENVELVANYLDYPNTFDAYFPFDSNIESTTGEFMVESSQDKNDYVRVKIYDRKYEQPEDIATPAGTFEATKVSFNYDVYNHKDKKTTTLKGVEWYAPGSGIVRAETYDGDNNLKNYSVLTALNK